MDRTASDPEPHHTPIDPSVGPPRHSLDLLHPPAVMPSTYLFLSPYPLPVHTPGPACGSWYTDTQRQLRQIRRPRSSGRVSIKNNQNEKRGSIEASSKPSTSGNQTKSVPGQTQPVLSPDAPTEATLSSPTVHRYTWDTGTQYVMWYTSRPLNWANKSRSPPGTLSGEIRMALSSDGLTWKRFKGPLDNGGILHPNSEDWWAFDTIHTSCGSVLLTHGTRVRTDGGVYLMYYTGGDTERMPISEDVKIAGGRTRIGVALSKDGEHFTRIEGEHPSSALLDVGDPPSFDDLFVAAPHVIYDPDAPPLARYIMYYHGANVRDRRFCIGRATSRDAFTFTRNPARKPVVSAASKTQMPGDMPWAEKGVCRPCVVRRGQNWVMFLEVIGLDSKHRIAMSESDDGIKWGPLMLVLDVGEPGEWDAAGVSHPCAVVPDDDDGVIVYYVGRREDHDIDGGRGTNIGLAQSTGPDWTQLERVSGGES